MALFTLFTSSKKTIVGLLLAFVVIASAFMAGQTAYAAPVVGFDPARIIDDQVFTNKSSMDVNQIQSFLNAQVPICDTNGVQVSELGGGTRAQWAASRGYSPPFTCLKDFSEGGKTSAQIIYDAAQEFSINPQVLIVLLQKEQSLITDTWPIPGSSQYRTATGYGCPDTAACDSQYFGLTNQVRWSARMFRAILNASPTWYTPYVLGNNYIQYSPNSSCGGSTVNIQNRSTQALYNYTPYQPNQGALNAGWGQAPCGAYGNRNFYLYFTNWFGTTYAYMYNGLSYTNVFNSDYYSSRYPDVVTSVGTGSLALFNHFIQYGMSEGRQGSESFNVTNYKNRYPDLRWTPGFGTNLSAYYIHYLQYGKAEGRVGTDPTTYYLTSLGGVDYSSIYNFTSYGTMNPDIKNIFGNNDRAMLQHFIQYGMSEGRQGSESFNVTNYKNRYPDLRNTFANNLSLYYLHYLQYGKAEGRIGN